MNMITQDSLADIEFQLRWKSNEAVHEERLFTKVNFWRDTLPPGLADQLMGKRPGDRVEARYAPGPRLLTSSPGNRISINANQFSAPTQTPRYGRFYPMGLLRGLPNVFSGNIKPFRIRGIDTGSLQVDSDHPLADASLEGSLRGATKEESMVLCVRSSQGRRDLRFSSRTGACRCRVFRAT